MPSFEVIEGDSVRVLQEMGAGSFDCVLTDPPYCNGGIKGSDRRKPTSKKIQFTGTKDVKPDFVGDMRDQRSYEKWLTAWMVECYRLLREGSFLMSFVDWRNLACTIDAVQVAGFAYRGVFCWVKPNARPQRNTFRNDVEFVVYGTKGMPASHGEDRYAKGYVEHMLMATSKRIHGTEKPVEVLESLLAFVPDGGRVLDPFCGSGATGEACRNLGLEFVGVEAVPYYADAARERLDRCWSTL